MDLSELADSRPSHSAKSNPIPEPSSPSIGLESPATTTCAPSQPMLFGETELPLTSSVAGSRAKTLAVQDLCSVWKASEAYYGKKSPVLLANLDPDLSSWKTSQGCLVSGWETFSGGWPRSGMMRSGTVYRLQPLEPPTNGIASGLLPTPRKGMRPRPCLKEFQALRDGLPVAFERLEAVLFAVMRVSPRSGLMVSPRFVERMMGFPIHWSSTGLWPSVTLSSRRSRS